MRILRSVKVDGSVTYKDGINGLSTEERQALELARRKDSRAVKNYVDKSAGSVIMESEKAKSELGTFKQRIANNDEIDKEYYDVIKTRFSHGSDFAQQIFNKYVPKTSVENSSYTGTPRYSKKTKKIYMNYSADAKYNSRGAGVTWFHEHGHLIDDALGTVSDSKEFRDLLHFDYMSYVQKCGKLKNLNNIDEIYTAISEDISDSMQEHSAVSDILNALSKGKINGVAWHERSYWNKYSKITGEAFAHMFECQFDAVRYKEMKKYFPKALDWFENTLKGALK